MERFEKEIVALIQMSDDKLEDLRVTLNAGRYKASVECSYYAMLNSVRAMLVTQGFVSSKHSQIISQFNYRFCKDGVVDQRYSKILEKAKDAREQCSYWPGYSVDEDVAKSWLGTAEEFTTDIRNYLLQSYPEIKNTNLF